MVAETAPKVIRPRIIFFGTPLFSQIALDALINDPRYEVCLVVTNPDRPAGRGKSLQPTPVRILAEKHNIPVLTVEKISKNVPRFLDMIQSLPGVDGEVAASFDVGVVVAFGQLLPLEVLNKPRCGSINLHGSLLPRWRGAAPMQRSIMEGDIITGVQLMQMEAGLDTGPVYATASVPLHANITFQELHDQLAVAGAQLLCENLFRIVQGALTAVPQPSEGVTYAKKITNEEARIDWSLPAARLVRLIHGISPLPGAFSFLDEKRVKIFRVAKRPSTSSQLPGTVTCATSDELRIQTGEGEIALLELQIEGKKRMHTKEFLSGVPLHPGQTFN